MKLRASDCGNSESLRLWVALLLLVALGFAANPGLAQHPRQPTGPPLGDHECTVEVYERGAGVEQWRFTGWMTYDRDGRLATWEFNRGFGGQWVGLIERSDNGSRIVASGGGGRIVSTGAGEIVAVRERRRPWLRLAESTPLEGALDARLYGAEDDETWVPTWLGRDRVALGSRGDVLVELDPGSGVPTRILKTDRLLADWFVRELDRQGRRNVEWSKEPGNLFRKSWKWHGDGVATSQTAYLWGVLAGWLSKTDAERIGWENKYVSDCGRIPIGLSTPSLLDEVLALDLGRTGYTTLPFR